MGFCYEISSGCCGCPIRSTVCTALCHYMVQGLLIVIFCFSNSTYPPYEVSDILFGGGGGALLIVSFFAAWTVDMKNRQNLRTCAGILTAICVVFHMVTTYFYAIYRWNDVMVTPVAFYFRAGWPRDFADPLWYSIVVILCITTPLFVTYLIYILSYLCNNWKSYLFTSPYQNNPEVSGLPTVVNTATVPQETYSTKDYKPYPIQKKKLEG